MINLKEYKDLKKVKIVHKDLIEIQRLLTTFISALEPHKKYIAVIESLNTLRNSKTLIEINLEKFKRLLEKAND